MMRPPVVDMFNAEPECAVPLGPENLTDAGRESWAAMGWEPRWAMSAVPWCPKGWSAVYALEPDSGEWVIVLGGPEGSSHVACGRYLSARQAEVMLAGWSMVVAKAGTRARWTGHPMSNEVISWWPL